MNSALLEAVDVLWTVCWRRCSTGWNLKSHCGCRTGQVEDAARMQFSTAYFSQCNEVALAGNSNHPLHDRCIAPAQQHGTATCEPCPISLAHVKHRQHLEGRGHRLGEGPKR